MGVTANRLGNGWSFTSFLFYLDKSTIVSLLVTVDKRSFVLTNFATHILLNIYFVISNLVCQLKVTLNLCLQYVTMIMLLVAISKLTYIYKACGNFLFLDLF